MGHADLDAARAAREEARAKAGFEPHTATRNGRTYELTPTLNALAADAYRQSNASEFVRWILANPDEADDFIHGRTAKGEDGPILDWPEIDDILPVWRVESGESSASAASSTNGGTRSRRTSTTTE